MAAENQGSHCAHSTKIQIIYTEPVNLTRVMSTIVVHGRGVQQNAIYLICIDYNFQQILGLIKYI